MKNFWSSSFFQKLYFIYFVYNGDDKGKRQGEFGPEESDYDAEGFEKITNLKLGWFYPWWYPGYYSSSRWPTHGHGKSNSIAKEITNLSWKKSVYVGKKLSNFRETVSTPALGKKAWKIKSRRDEESHQ